MIDLPKRKLDTLIPIAIDVINSSDMCKNGKVADTYHGYISSLGADMINSSPLAAVIFAEGSLNSDEYRGLVPKAVLDVLKKHLGTTIIPDKHKELSAWMRELKVEGTNRQLPNIMAAAIALKIALRTFPKQKKATQANENP